MRMSEEEEGEDDEAWEPCNVQRNIRCSLGSLRMKRKLPWV